VRYFFKTFPALFATNFSREVRFPLPFQHIRKQSAKFMWWRIYSFSLFSLKGAIDPAKVPKTYMATAKELRFLLKKLITKQNNKTQPMRSLKNYSYPTLSMATSWIYLTSKNFVNLRFKKPRQLILPRFALF
jgi:hypothetical protein